MILIAATHKWMDVRTTFEGNSLEEVERRNSKYWHEFEVVG